MTREEILSMEAEELRQRIGENIFGYIVEVRKGFRSFGDGTFIEDPTDRISASYALCYIADRWTTEGGEEVLVWEELPYYSTNISAAWQVVERMRELDYLFSLTNYDNYKLEYQARFYNRTSSHSGFGAAPEAICKAALLAKLEEVKND